MVKHVDLGLKSGRSKLRAISRAEPKLRVPHPHTRQKNGRTPLTKAAKYLVLSRKLRKNGEYRGQGFP